MTWRPTPLHVLIFNLLGFLACYLLLRLQNVLPLNPQNFSAVGPDLAFNTASSFATNTNWESYGGETVELPGPNGRARRAELRFGRRGRPFGPGSSTWSRRRNSANSCWSQSWMRVERQAGSDRGKLLRIQGQDV